MPSELGDLASLKQLVLTNNAGISGALPARVTALRQLEVLMASGTSLCVPSDASFQRWLEAIGTRRIQSCVGAESKAFLTQAVQSPIYPVPLVAGEEALLRVFVTAAQPTNEPIPAVRARFYLGGQETHVADIPAQTSAIPTQVDESALSKSANATIPAEVIQPGLSMVIEIDPAGTLDAGLGVTKRMPETGRMRVDVAVMPTFDLTVIPFLWSTDPDSSVIDLAREMAADPRGHGLLERTRTLLPVGDINVQDHEPVLSTSNDAYELLHQTEMIRAMEGGSGHYLGMMPKPLATGVVGVAQLGGKAAFSVPRNHVIAHELGHNMSLGHAPCGSADGRDPLFPGRNGAIGAWGYDFRDGGRLVSPRTSDVMGYCQPSWIGDYHFAKALRFRLDDEGGKANQAASSAKSLLLWGDVNAEGEPFLQPAFVVDAPPALPQAGSEYNITGRATSGDELFSVSFSMQEVADGDGRSSFVFVLPVHPAWEGNLASLTLSGPGGSVTLDGEGDPPMAILRNRRSGQVRGILRDLPPATQAAVEATGSVDAPGLEVLFSRGIPGVEAWRR